MEKVRNVMVVFDRKQGRWKIKWNNVRKPLCRGVSMKSKDTIGNYIERRDGAPYALRSIDLTLYTIYIYIYSIFPALDGIRKIGDERNTKGRRRIKRKKKEKKRNIVGK